jgi:fructose-1-phosphate kinase PfkB-like protein
MDLLRKVDAIMLTNQEAKLLAGEISIISAVRKLLGLGLMHVIIYDRDFGATLFSQNIVLLAPAYPNFNAKDPTGMSYSFAGAFLGYISWVNELKSKSYKKALKYGIILASFTQEEYSVKRLRSLTHADIENRLNIYSDMI